jgi:hypothetical protein
MTNVGYAEIYIIISPSGKKYIGKANCMTSTNKSHGTQGRWKSHIYDSRAQDGGRCRLLNEEIRKYDHKLFIVTPLLTCKVNDTPIFERLFIQEYNTLHCIDNPMGLNILQGGNYGPLPESVRMTMSINRKIKPHFTKPHTEETKKQISESLIDIVKRYDHKGNILPKYIKYVNWNDRRGYQIVSHPKCKCKYFVSTKTDLDVLYSQCYDFLETLSQTENTPQNQS